MNPMLAKLKNASRRLETTNPRLGFQISKLVREIRGAKSSAEVQLETWDDFAAWWNTNRSQGLLFQLIDALGEGNPVIKQLQDVMTQQDALERQLHDAYLQLKGKAPSTGLPAESAEAPAEAPAEELAPAITAPAEEPLSDLTEELPEGV